ncbi:hypothetical protein [Staphylococcus haemolyticus]|uniref:hypothetical protein n=1 Tax=Staphylococcus haemolyticus TaxID=1283 RepID=UPI002900BC3D|nr:hypothetical protein [Staphylococcus haemolyticus]MDU0439385.1 hypothetical protein [Staphylococcus haemolyticus]
MYIDPLRNVRGIINKTVSDLESAKRTALKPLLLSNQNLTNTLEINKQLKNQLLRMGSVNVVNLKLSELITLTRKSSFNWNSTYISNPYNFQRNLFSEKAIKSFKNSYGFDDDIVSQAQQTIRDFYINPTAISTLTESINATYPVNNQNTHSRYDEFINALKNDYPHPFKTVIRWSSGIVGSADIGNFATNYINDNDLHIQNSLILAIVCLISFLSTYYPKFNK